MTYGTTAWPLPRLYHLGSRAWPQQYTKKIRKMRLPRYATDRLPMVTINRLFKAREHLRRQDYDCHHNVAQRDVMARRPAKAFKLRDDWIDSLVVPIILCISIPPRVANRYLRARFVVEPSKRKFVFFHRGLALQLQRQPLA